MWLAPAGLVFWLAVDGSARSLGDLVSRIDALVRVAEELDAHLAKAGLGGLDAAATLRARIGGVFDAVSVADLDDMMRGVEELRRELDLAASRMTALRELKQRVEATKDG